MLLYFSIFQPPGSLHLKHNNRHGKLQSDRTSVDNTALICDTKRDLSFFKQGKTCLPFSMEEIIFHRQDGNDSMSSIRTM